jgi:hypothetical protein
MPDEIVMVEVLSSGSMQSTGDNSNTTLNFKLSGSMDRSEIWQFVNLNTEPIVDGLPRTSIKVDPIDETRDLWEAEVIYSNIPITQTQNIGDLAESFNTGGKTSRIFNALEHIADYGPVGEGQPAPPNHKGAINVDKEGRVEGTEITIPTYGFQIRKKMDAKNVTPAFKAIVYNSTGRVNGSSFKGFAKGEVMFLGANGNQVNDESWDIVMNFEASPNELNLQVGEITGIVKEGWHYLWVEFDEIEDPTSSRLVKSPIAAHVERVFQYTDLNGLGVS